MDSAFYLESALTLDGSAAESVLTASVSSAPACGGPWSDDLQHGGPPTALLVRMAETLARYATGRNDLTALRVASEFVGAVPVAELTVRARINRSARSAMLVTAELEVAGRRCLEARIWLLSQRRNEGDGSALEPDFEPPESAPPFEDWRFPYMRHLDWRSQSGSVSRPGPAATWVRSRIPLLTGEELSSLQRAALIGDSASGISAELDWAQWSFTNVDLDLHLSREMTGDWILLDAQTLLGDGAAMTSSVLSDRDGVAGAGLQTLLVRRHR